MKIIKEYFDVILDITEEQAFELEENNVCSIQGKNKDGYVLFFEKNKLQEYLKLTPETHEDMIKWVFDKMKEPRNPGRQTKDAKAVFTRNCCMYVLKKHYDFSFAQAGKVFGLSPALAMYSINKYINPQIEKPQRYFPSINNNFIKQFNEIMIKYKLC